MKIHIKAGKGKFFTEKELIEAAKEKPVENLDDKIKEDKSFKLQGKMEFQGMKIAIENKKGSVRRGVDDDGEEWKTKMFYPYGFIVGTEGVDHDEVDCFVGPNNESSTVFIIHQQNPETKKYDEDKCMLGFDTLEQARDAYLAHYDDQAFLGTITQMDIQEFKNKLKTRKGKIIKAFDKVLAFIKGKQFNPGQFSMFGSSNDAPVIEGQTVSKDGKIYEYRVSKKNPFVKRLFRKEDEPGMFDAPKEEPEHGAEPGTNSEIKPETKKPEEKPESKKKPKIKLGNQEFDLFAQDKTEDKKEPISPEIKPDDSKKEPENKPDNKPSESENKPKPNKDPKPKEETQEEIETAAEVVKGKKTREKLNEQVRQILESKTDEELTAEDLQVIAKYSGRGGLGGDNLDDISLNEFYTREVEIGFIWDIIRKFGYNGGRALEPSAGTGNFIRLAPGDTIVTGVEIDPISSRVGKILYGDKHDMLEAQSFEEFNRNSDGGEFDAVIGNCPFGQRGGSLVHDPEKKDIMKHEQYFIDRGIDALKNGGVLGMIVPTGVMDNQWNDWRLEINKKAEFLGAIRLPDGAFKHANAAVTTDIVFFRKRPQEVIDYLQNVKKSDLPALYDNMILDAEFIAGKYYENNPQYAIGEKTRGQFESQTVWKGNVRREDLDQVGEILKDNQDDYSSLGIDIAPVPETQLNVGDIKQVNGRTYRLNENHRWERVSEEEQKEIEVSDEVKTMLGIKNYAEFEALRQDTARVIELTRDQIKLLENPLWNKELELHEVQGDYKNEMLKRAVIIGLEIKQFRQDLFDGKLSTSEAQMKAEKLSGLLENFKNEYGHPIHNARLDKYFKKSNEKPLVYISGAFDDKGNLAQIFSDPAAYYKVYNTSFEVGALDDKDILNIVNYFFENHIPADLESIKNSYTGEENVERALL
ncbi:MAG: Eco57I restriction-modification methylase domain-containing protein, partial [Bacillota bacterium]